MTGDQSMHARPAQTSVESDYPAQPAKQRARHALRLAALLAISTAAGCGGDSDDPPAPPPASNSGGNPGGAIVAVSNRAPVLNQLTLSPDSADFLAGAGRTPIRVTGYYTDADSDAVTLRVALSDGTMPAVATPSAAVVAGAALGTPVVGDFELATSTARRLTVEAWVVDAAGNASNRMSAALTVRGNARLSALNLSAGALEQIFQPGLKSYTASVSLLRPTTTVTVTAEDPAATLTVEGHAVASGVASRKLTLDQGRNELDVVVTAADGTTATYTVDVTRRTAATFGQELYLKSDKSEAGVPGAGFQPRPSHFGTALSFDGRRLGVGAWGEDAAGLTDAGVLYFYERDAAGVWQREVNGKLTTPSVHGDNDEPHFGANFLLAGDTLFVAEIHSWTGSPSHVPLYEGRVHVYSRAFDRWAFTETLFPSPRPRLQSRFGMGLAAQPGMLVVGDPVGAQVRATGPTGSGTDAAYGAVSIFTPSANGWVQSQYLTSPAPDLDDSFGERVALDGDLLAIGAPGEDSAPNGTTADPHDDSTSNAGAVFVMRREAGVWILDAMLKAPNGDAGDAFGSAVVLSGDTLVVSAPGEDSSAVGIGGNQADNGATGSGAAYVFARDSAGRWQFESYIKASNTGAGDSFGLASWFNLSPLALAGDVLVVGAQGEDSASTGVNGDQSSNSVQSAGAAYVFTRDAQRRWTQVAYLKASNPSEFDNFGSVALGEDLVAVGAAYESSLGVGLNGDQTHHPVLMGYGAVYVFR